jgi:hypothetical protein
MRFNLIGRWVADDVKEQRMEIWEQEIAREWGMG